MAQAHPISDSLISWYKKNKRDLPWRITKDPYRIWLSEIMLQQTQVIQGLSYYLKFTETFPTIIDLAKAPEDTVMRLWQGLGYYSRARNLHATAKVVAKEYKGIFPKTYEEIKALKGIGDYTAAAIASIAFDLPYAVVDGNVYRVLARLFNITTPINSTQGKKEFQQLADELLNQKKAALHNSALMELGALVCKPQNPKCDECPLSMYCLAYKNILTLSLPVKEKKIKIKNRYFNYIIFNYKNSVYITKRTEKDIWQNLYEFFLIETDHKADEETILKSKELKNVIKEFDVLKITETKKHILSHQHLYSTFYELKIDKELKLTHLKKIPRAKIKEYAFPQLINKYLTHI